MVWAAEGIMSGVSMDGKEGKPMDKTMSKYFAKRKQQGPAASDNEPAVTSPLHLRRSARLATQRGGEQAEARPHLDPRLVRKRQCRPTDGRGASASSAGLLGSLPEEVGLTLLYCPQRSMRATALL